MSFLFGRMAGMGVFTGAVLVATGSLGLSGSGGVIPLTGGAVGDLAVVHTFNNLNGDFTAPAGWTTDSQTLGGLSTQLFTKVLAASDVATGSATWTAGGGFHPNSFALVAIYRGATAAARKATAYDNSGAVTLTLTGFTKSGLCAGVVSFTSTPDAVTPTLPAGFASEISATIASQHTRLADILRASNYTDAASVVWSGYSGVNFKYAWLVELTN